MNLAILKKIAIKVILFNSNKLIAKRKGDKKMTKKKTVLKRVVEEIAIKVATADANAACPCLTYQPKVPTAVKKLRKF